MLSVIYAPGSSFLHALRPSIKLMGFILLTSLIFFYPSLYFSIALLVATTLTFWLCKLPRHHLTGVIKSSAWLMVILFGIHLYLHTLAIALMICTRLLSLLILATIFTLTTRMSDMIDTIEAGFMPLKWIGINPSKMSLSFSLAIRFIPLLVEITASVREAQSIRGANKNIFALLIPVLIRTFQVVDELSQAIDARGYESQEKTKIPKKPLNDNG